MGESAFAVLILGNYTRLVQSLRSLWGWRLAPSPRKVSASGIQRLRRSSINSTWDREVHWSLNVGLSLDGSLKCLIARNQLSILCGIGCWHLFEMYKVA